MSSILPRPKHDPEIANLLSRQQQPNTITPEISKAIRADPTLMPTFPNVEEYCQKYPVTHTERVVPGIHNNANITLSIFTPTSLSTGPRPCLYHIHGGGMIFFDRFAGVVNVLRWVELADAIVVTVEYRLAPENPYPAGVNDCYAGVKWTSEHAAELGIDQERIMIVGHSGGGGLAADTALMCRDLKGPKICAQFLGCPMLDDRNNTLSSQQYLESGSWTTGSNRMAWDCVLPGTAGSPNTSKYAAPARATVADLSGLPRTFIDVGDAEVFRDESVAHASKLWAAGVSTDLHVYAGGYHGYDGIAPEARISLATFATQRQWVKDALKLKEEIKAVDGDPDDAETLA